MSFIRTIVNDVINGLKKYNLTGFYYDVVGKRAYRVDNRLLGKVVEYTGNAGKLDGCTFDLNDPAIATPLKARFLLKIYELEERLALRQYLDNSIPVIELGACIGVVSCITNKMLSQPTRHIVVEANPNLINILTRNRDLNQCKFDIVHRAVAYGTDEVTFFLHPKFVGGSIHYSEGQAVTVETTTIRSLAEKSGFDRFNLLCDIEGAEIDLIENEVGFLRNHAKTIMMEVHPDQVGSDKIQSMSDMLIENGFSFHQPYHHLSVFINDVLADSTHNGLKN